MTKKTCKVSLETDNVAPCVKMMRQYSIPIKQHLSGAPDWAFFCRKGVTIFVEFKKKGKEEADPHQEKFHKKLRGIGHIVILHNDGPKTLMKKIRQELIKKGIDPNELFK